MGLLGTQTAYQYYTSNLKFIATAGQTAFTVNGDEAFDPAITSANQVYVFVNGIELDPTEYSYASNVITLIGITLEDDDEVVISLKESRLGTYRYIGLDDIVNNFIVSYVGDNKLIQKAKRLDVLFHAKRALQEFSYDISRVEKIQEVEMGPALAIPMPQDYVSLVEISWVDEGGLYHPIPIGRYTEKPSEAIAQDENGGYLTDSDGSLTLTTSLSEERFKSTRVIENDEYGLMQGQDTSFGQMYGADPVRMNSNGVVVIDEKGGRFTFSSDLANKIIAIKYISDSLGTDGEMKVHKFAEEAIYKHIAYAIASSYITTPEYIVNRLKREKRASMRNAKLRLYNLNLKDLTQTMRGKSKIIKH